MTTGRTMLRGIRLAMAACALLLAAATACVAQVEITAVKAEAKERADGSTYVTITYQISGMSSEGAIVSMEPNIKSSDPNDTASPTPVAITPTAEEMTGDIGNVLSNGKKTIEWDAQQTLTRINKEGEYTCVIKLAVEGQGEPTSVTLTINKYAQSAWDYFATGGITLDNLKKTGTYQEVCGTLGGHWEQTVDAGATFYKGDVLGFPTYRGRNPNDKYSNVTWTTGCSSFLAIAKKGTAEETIWVNFTRHFTGTHIATGVVHDYEFQFRYFGKRKGGTMALKVGNAGRQGQQLFNELNQGEDFVLTLRTDSAKKAESDPFPLKVVRRQYKYSYKGSPVLLFKAIGEKARFIGSGPGMISLDGGELEVNGWLRFSGSFNLDTVGKKFSSSGSWSTGGGKHLFNSLFANLDSGITPTGGPLFDSDSAWYIASAATDVKRFGFASFDNADGLLMDIRLPFRELQEGCRSDQGSTGSDQPGLVLRGVKFDDDGWHVDGATVASASLAAAADLCMKELKLSYDKSKATLSAELLASHTLFDEMGGTLTMHDGRVKSLELKMGGQSDVPVPIPSIPGAHATVWTDFDVTVSNLENGPIALEGPATLAARSDWENAPAFSAVAAAVKGKGFKLFELDGPLKKTYKGDISMAGPSRFLGGAGGWRMQGKGESTVIAGGSLLQIVQEGTFTIADLGGGKWLFTGGGKPSFTFASQFDLSATMGGQIYISDLFKNNPFFNIIHKRQKLPISLDTGSVQVNNTNLSFVWSTGVFGIVNVSVDLGRNPTTEPRQFIRVMNNDTIAPGRAKDAGGNTILGAADTVYRTIPTTADMQRAFVQIWGDPAPPVSFLVAPSGTRYDGTSTDSSVIYMPPVAPGPDEDGMWVIKNPGAGTWKLGMVNGGAGDSIYVWALRQQRPPFALTSAAQGRTITATWNTDGAPQEGRVSFYLDNDDRDYDGLHIGSVAETVGTFSYTLTDSLRECGYYLHATRWEEGIGASAYSPTHHGNSKSWLAPPTNISAVATASGLVTVTWNSSSDPKALQYLIRVTDAGGKDSIYASLYHTYTMAQFQLDGGHVGKRISLLTVGEDNLRGCWSDPVSFTLAGVEENEAGETASRGIMIHVAPQPVSDRAIIYANVTARSLLFIDLYDNAGRLVRSLGQGVFEPGTVRAELDASSLPNGVYFVRFTGNGIAGTEKIVVRK